jgi:hypothetical protein
MTRITVDEHDHLRVMIETMQRDGRPEAMIHEAVRRAMDGDRPRRRDRRRPDVLRLLGRRPSRT